MRYAMLWSGQNLDRIKIKNQNIANASYRNIPVQDASGNAVCQNRFLNLEINVIPDHVLV